MGFGLRRYNRAALAAAITQTLAQTGLAATVTWSANPFDSPDDWNTAANWNPASVPTSADDARFQSFTGGAVHTVTLSGAGVASSLTVTNGHQLVLNATPGLTVTNGVTVQQYTPLTISAGTANFGSLTTVGQASTFRVNGGATTNVAGNVRMGFFNGSASFETTTFVSGAGSKLDVDGLMDVGSGVIARNNTLSVDGGATLDVAGQFTVGRSNDSGFAAHSNSATITGAGTTANLGSVKVGTAEGTFSGTTYGNTLNITNGALVTVANNFAVSQFLGGTGATVNNQVTVGGAEGGQNARLVVNNGFGYLEIGNGFSGESNLTVNSGGSVTVGGLGAIVFGGVSSGQTNALRVDGGTYTSGSTLRVDGNLRISNGGSVNVQTLDLNTAASGTVTFSNGTLTVGNTTVNASAANVAIGDNAGTADSLLSLTTAGTHNFRSGLTVRSDGVLQIGGGATVTASSLNIAGQAGNGTGVGGYWSSGTVNTAATNVTNAAQFVVGNDAGGAATLNLQGGTHSFAGGLRIARDTGGSNLTGNGTVVGALANNGNIAPGGASAIGTINVTGDTAFSGTNALAASLVADIVGDATDVLAVNGNLDLSGSFDQLAVNFSGVQTLQRYELVTYTGNLSGTFDTLIAPGWMLDTSEQGVIAVAVVPEPTALGVLSLLALPLLARRRRVR